MRCRSSMLSRPAATRRFSPASSARTSLTVFLSSTRRHTSFSRDWSSDVCSSDLSTHVRGIGVMNNGTEQCRIQVTLATGIPESVCKKINLGYRDPKSIRPEDFANREDEGILLVPKAGEMLYHLEHQPKWAGGNGG